MGSLRRASRQSMTLGQASSQVRSTEAGTPVADQSVLVGTSNGGTGKKKKSHKSRRKNKAAIEGPSREQESARALLQLKEKVPLNGESIPAGGDEIATPTMLSAVNGIGKDSIETHGRDEARQVTDISGKRKRQRHEFREHESNFTVQGRDDRSSKRARLNKSINKFKSQMALLSSSLITSDVTKEETTANLRPGDEQEVFSSGTSPITQTMAKPKPITQRLIGETDNERSDTPIHPSDRLPSLVFDTSQRQNHLKERKNQSQFSVESAAAQEQPNHRGQQGSSFVPHSSDFVSQMWNPLTYLFRQTVESPHPIDSVLTSDSQPPIYTPLEKSAVIHRHENANQQHNTNTPAETTGDIGSHVDMLRGRTNQPKGRGGNKKRRVPPETEDVPLLPSSDSDSFDDWSLNSEDSDDPTSKAKVGRMTPPPLAKPSKPLGNKTQQGGKKAKNYDPPLDQIAVQGGVWTQAEISKLETFRDNYCTENELSTFQFNALVQSSIRYDKTVTDFFNEVHAAFPYRTRMSVTRVCRRRFHNFTSRGTWTQSEDERLKQAVLVKGRSWKAVGEMINRFPEDCRDRYRNYHINAQNRNRESWTDAEILNLCRAVHDCMMKMKEHNEQAKSKKFVGREVPESESESDEEVRDAKLINWQIVSDSMGPGGGRSRLQCSLKWAQLRMMDRAKHMKRVNDALGGRSPTDNDKTKNPRRGNWRVRQALRTLDNMKPGDRYDFLQAFATCNAREEGNIAWKLLGDEAFRSRWTSAERKAALQIFKSEVPGGNDMNYRDVANRLLTKLMAESSQKLGERWERGQDPDTNVKMRKLHSAEKDSRRKGIAKKSRRKGLPMGVEDEKGKRDKQVISSDVQEEENNVQEAIEHEEILLSQSAIYDEAEVKMPNEDMSAEASNRKGQEGPEASHLSVAAIDDESRQDQPDEDVGFDTDDDSIFGNGNESAEPEEAPAHDGTRESSSGEVIYALPARSGKAAAVATQEDSSEEDATGKVRLVPQTNALPKMDEASVNDRLHNKLSDKDVITAAFPLSQVPESPLRNSTASNDDETQLHGDDENDEDDDNDNDEDNDDDDDDDVSTASDADSLFGKPGAG